jgi:phytoene synthase
MAKPQPDDVAYLAGLVREADRPRYYSTLFARSQIRGDLFALYGFAAEIERIPDQVSEPTLGEIRLRWWRDALTGGSEFSSEGQSPALRAISGAIARHALPVGALVALIDARSADLYSDPPPGMADIEAYFDRTQGTVFRLAGLICGGAGAELEATARHAGIAYGLSRRLAGSTVDAARRRTIFPADLLVLENLTAAEIFVPEPHAGLQNMVAALGQLARHHLRAARDRLTASPRHTLPPFLPLATVEPLVAQVDRLGGQVFQRPASLSDLKLLLSIGSAWLRRRV